MSHFSRLLEANQLSKHDGRPLWKYSLSDDEYYELKNTLRTASNFYSIDDSRDITLYFTEWWKREYNGGKPSKEEVFLSLNRNSDDRCNHRSLFDLAKEGALKLGIRWIKKQNTLYFRTLLLQGGMPLNHISQNIGTYGIFLSNLLDKNYKSVEDIIYDTTLTRILPHASQNEVIYENCLSIIESFQKGDRVYQDIFNRNQELANVYSGLLLKSRQNRQRRMVKPAAFWSLQEKNGTCKISLKLGFSALYSPEDIQQLLNLSGAVDSSSYQIFFNDFPVCTFRRVLSGNYKTQWSNMGSLDWDYQDTIPQLYFVSGSQQRGEIADLITFVPSLDEPTLWVSVEDREWRFIKGDRVSLEEATVLCPISWTTDAIGVEQREILINHKKVNLFTFSGQVTFSHNTVEKIISTQSETFDWVIQTQKPTWILRSNIPATSNYLHVRVYNKDAALVHSNQYSVFYKRVGDDIWIRHLNLKTTLPIGALDVKIEYEGMVGYDKVYNVGSIQCQAMNNDLNHAELRWTNLSGLNVTLDTSDNFQARVENTSFLLDRNVQNNNNKIPKSIRCKLKRGTERSLYFDIESPFRGVGLLDFEGRMIGNNSVISLNELLGHTIITSDIENTTIELTNELRSDVKFYKKMSLYQQPLIRLRDSFRQLFYLADSMDHTNKVKVKVTKQGSQFTFFVTGFTHRIDSLDYISDGKFKLNREADFRIFAYRLSTQPIENPIIPLDKTLDGFYEFPSYLEQGQFIVFSDLENGKQVQPRFLNTELTYEGEERTNRIQEYAELLLESDFQSTPWSNFLGLYSLCVSYKLPFSTFDKLRAIVTNSQLAAKAFVYLSLYQQDIDEFVQNYVPMLEQDLGFCFHWINKNDWEYCIREYGNWNEHDISTDIINGIRTYYHHNDLNELYVYVSNGNKGQQALSNQYIIKERARLGDRVTNELPRLFPHITQEYGINVDQHSPIKLIFHSAIAVAESIMGKQKMTIWSLNNDIIRRNIQYVQHIAPELYKNIILKALCSNN